MHTHIHAHMHTHTCTGDTITVVGYLGTQLYKFSVRVLGCDTPEMRGKSEHEKALARKAKEFVKSLCLDKIVTLKNHGKEKYGRVLAEVWVNNVNLSEALIAEGLAYKYEGGAKRDWGAGVGPMPTIVGRSP